jgi:hypothetical protein
LPECWIPGHRERRHGSHYTCRLLAEAARADPTAIDYDFRRRVLQKRWRMTYDHVLPVARARITARLPPLDLHDAIQLLLIANADRTDE